ncbi:MarR family transcriptional regulator [Streptomyces sp. AK04-3B]|uniref:MarR family winged helix-turn-helix transcriptional regulator n=1 Tax=unclassified Streptomyces TaxID=2593676 RepID=UPI0029B9BBDE|nr:MarR family transcriptional regulator [Streptomyces sp. AK04-3B]MDX3800668.1 MarR family transcriptional regulator [Streptomyces sp. AK04-3B]
MTDEEPAADRSLLLLDEQLCFALYAAQRAVTAAYRPLLDELGLTYPQYLVLLVLWERGETRVKDLASALRLDYGTMSPLLKRLEAAGLVRRERAAHDERSVLVACTGPGEELRRRAERVPEALLASTGLETAEIARLREELWGLAERAHPTADRTH